jgi:hypothetical protein
MACRARALGATWRGRHWEVLAFSYSREAPYEVWHMRINEKFDKKRSTFRTSMNADSVEKYVFNYFLDNNSTVPPYAVCFIIDPTFKLFIYNPPMDKSLFSWKCLWLNCTFAYQSGWKYIPQYKHYLRLYKCRMQIKNYLNNKTVFWLIEINLKASYYKSDLDII